MAHAARRVSPGGRRTGGGPHGTLDRARVVEGSGCGSERASAIDAVGGGVNGEEYLQFLVEAARLVAE